MAYPSEVYFGVCQLKRDQQDERKVHNEVNSTIIALLEIKGQHYLNANEYGPRHEISNNVVCTTSKASDQPAHTRSLIRAFASRLNIL